jgi:hypothetical protein
MHWDRGVGGAKDERGSVDGPECARHDEFSALVRLVQKSQMLLTILGAAM